MYKSIRELDIFISDGNYSSKYPRSEEFVDEGIPFIRGNNMIDGEIVDEDMYYITEKKHGILLKGHIQPGDVLITTRGNIGQVAIVPERHNDSNINAQIVLLRVNKEELYNRYLLWALQSYKTKEQYLSLQTGTALKQLPVGKLEQVKIKYVDLKLQVQIAEILDKAYQVIKIRKNELMVLDNLIKARFVELFGDPEVNSMNLPVKPMTEVCEIIDGDRGKNYPTQEEFSDEGYCLFLNAKNVTSNGFSFENCMFVTKEKDEILRKGHLNRGDVVLTTRGTIGNLAFYDESVPYENVRINSGMVILRMNHEIVSEHFFIEQFKMQLGSIKEKIASGSAQPQLPISTMNKIVVLMPSVEQQLVFADFVQQVDKSKVAVQKALDEAQLLFDSLMQKYFG